MFRVVVDDREVGSGAVAALRRVDEVDVVVQRLAVGDYAWDGRLLFERTRLIDLAASLKDGRLLRQACRLAAAPMRGVVILEGTTRDLAASGMRREAIQGALISITVMLGLPLLRAKDPEESARLMYYAARQRRTLGGAAARETHPRPLPARRPKGKRRTQLYILQGVPGVGPRRARRLLERFGSVEAALTASLEDLTSVSGIGQATAEAIRWAVSEQAHPYTLPDDDPAL
ncbi:MAG: helix-hairpin-helix domain-containing protein [Proteobacteria bacterium]|nr:helix-hairpin-helix domain-containing protein [Pseudomonadota bacterium]